MEDLRHLLANLADAADAVTEPPTAASARVLICSLPDEAIAARRFIDESSALQSGPHAWQPPGQRLDLTELAAVERALAQADVARFVRRQRIWDLSGPTPVAAMGASSAGPRRSRRHPRTRL